MAAQPVVLPTWAPTPLDTISQIRSDLETNFRTGKTRDIEFRRDQLLGLAYLVQENRVAIHEALRKDLGRSEHESDIIEIGGTLGEILTAYKSVGKWSKSERPPFAFNYFAMRPTIRKEPKGVVLILVPFNYPILLSLGPLASAIAAGCPCVVKPSELTTAVGALFAELFPKYLDPSFYRVVNGAVPETTRLLEQPWGHILFTGSGRIAKIVLAAAAKTLTPVTTELGGKSPVIVDPSCDLKTTCRRILWGKTANAGQTCVAPDYILVPRSFHDTFVTALRETLNEYYPGGAASSDSYSRIVSPAHHKRLVELLDNTEGKVTYGGKTTGATVDGERFIEPTVVTGVSIDDSLMRDEIFGPILPIIAVEDIDEAIRIVNSRDYPLALYVFARDAKVKKKVFESTQSGSVLANDVLLQVTADGLPFGGIGPSGSGQHTGKYGFDMFTHMRATLDNPSWLDLIMSGRFPPFTDKSTKIIRAMATPSLPPRKASSAPNPALKT
ncbi:unnamed protein product [Peniophora sp. CBMAI 1063]|nr:unnamed protein product [Peniophora sp. CBMAI 1063]